ncbi:MAG: single-stranded-DNA-specific exonuclease RecJ [Nostocaceae cyanobacterium]|nr:single-stranded-DNA-specific exonuclease RecJ [Nostocaceae cyanobacterium]
MTNEQWILTAVQQPPEWFIVAVRKHAPNISGEYAAVLLWQRGIRNESQLAGFVNFKIYQPASPFEFGQEMHLAVNRLELARKQGEKVAIWGDFDADGITSTAVLWDGLGEFFQPNKQLIYYIPNRLTESHGLNLPGIDSLFEHGCKLIVTCDTGSTNISEIEYANQLGIDVIVTDHHTLPPQRPPVTAIINPRYLHEDHQLFHLSGVAVAYKLVEALYEVLPEIPRQPLAELWDLVAIGLIADLVQLSGDCRYLAQLGIERLQEDYKQPPQMRRRPGVGKLLELCHRSGDRPTDISFGLGPRINAVSRIHGNARFCVELLTSRDIQRVHQLAQDTELANTRRKSLQKDVAQQVNQKLKQLDLSTTSVIVLEDPQWQLGVLGLVAGQIAQSTGRPTILLSTAGATDVVADVADELAVTSPIPCARGSARSVNSVDLYQLVKDQAHLLHRFGGHPFAAGLSLPVENIPLFTAAINQRLRQSGESSLLTPTVQADACVTVADLGKDLFLELKLLEPCGIGNPVPKLLIQNCWFENPRHRHQQDLQGKKVQYIKTEFLLRDDSTLISFPGVWWEHYTWELPQGRCDCIVELDYNTFKKAYEIRLLAVRPSVNSAPSSSTVKMAKELILDWREIYQDKYADWAERRAAIPSVEHSALLMTECPTSWDDLRAWLRRAIYNQQQLAIAWSTPSQPSAREIWLTLVGIAKYLSRTQQSVTRVQMLEKLRIGDQALHLGFRALRAVGFKIERQDRSLQLTQHSQVDKTIADAAVEQFLAAVREEQFQRQYFAQVPLSTIQAVATLVIG